MATTDYNVEEKDTVAGRLNSSANLNSPFAKRVASFAKREGASKGLTRSSITIGNALGNVVDQSVGIATTDSTNIINSKVQGSINETSRRNTDANNSSSERIATAGHSVSERIAAAGNTSSEKIATAGNTSSEKIATIQSDTSKANTKLTTDTQKAIQADADIKAGERLATQIASQTSEAALDRTQSTENLATQVASSERIADAAESNKAALAREGFSENRQNLIAELGHQENIALRELAARISMEADGNEIRREELASQEFISTTNLAAARERDTLDRASRELIASLDNSSQVALEKLRQDFDSQRQHRDHVANIELETLRGINNIDSNASAASKDAAVKQITEAATATLASANAAIAAIRLNSLVAKSSDPATAATLTSSEIREAYEIARENGLTAEEMNAMAGLPAGSTTTQDYIASQGWEPLGASTATDSPSSSSSPTQSGSSAGTNVDQGELVGADILASEPQPQAGNPQATTLSATEQILVDNNGWVNNGDGTLSAPDGRTYDSDAGGFVDNTASPAPAAPSPAPAAPTPTPAPTPAPASSPSSGLSATEQYLVTNNGWTDNGDGTLTASDGRIYDSVNGFS